MKYSRYFILLHSIIFNINLISIFLLDYKYLMYPILIISFIIFGWLVNKHCIISEYETFIECTYDKVEDTCTKVNKGLKFCISDLFNFTWIVTITGLIICIARYKYKFNFIEINNNVFNKLLLSIGLVIYNLLFLALFEPAIKYYVKYKNIKFFILYILFYIVIIGVTIYYFIQEHL